MSEINWFDKTVDDSASGHATADWGTGVMRAGQKEAAR
jgi:hypothetical protein